MMELKGSTKQIAWAEDIIRKAYDTVELNIEHQHKNIEPKAPEFAAKEIEIWEEIRKELDVAFASYTNAGDIIASRNSYCPAQLTFISSKKRMRRDNSILR